MRHTPYLDSLGITFKDRVSDYAVNIIDHLLELTNRRIDWGEYEGRKRKPCPEQPLLLTGMPIGMYHCPVCGMMILAALPHLEPTDPTGLPYELEYGAPWPAGYEE